MTVCYILGVLALGSFVWLHFMALSSGTALNLLSTLLSTLFRSYLLLSPENNSLSINDWPIVLFLFFLMWCVFDPVEEFAHCGKLCFVYVVFIVCDAASTDVSDMSTHCQTVVLDSCRAHSFLQGLMFSLCRKQSIVIRTGRGRLVKKEWLAFLTNSILETNC